MSNRQNKKTEIIDAAKLDTYFQLRMHQMGIANTDDYTIETETDDFPSRRFHTPIFAETPTGNIVITYPCLYGGLEVIANTETPFTRLRYKPENQHDSKVKYFQEPQSGIHIFFPPLIVEKFRTKTHIDTLILVEGEFKALSGSIAGLDIVGLGGKDSFRDEDKKNLHPDIQAIIRDCTVNNIMLLLDADTKQVKWLGPDDEPDKDLAKGLFSFFNTACNFREAAKAATGLRDIYFSSLGLDNLPDQKGLDDLLFAKRQDGTGMDYVTNDILRLGGAKVYFETINIGLLSPNKIRSHFWLNFYRSVPSAFYANNEPLLKGHEFKFSGATFQFKADEGLTLIKHADSDKFVRVECDYYKNIEVPDPNGILQPNLVVWKQSIITLDYGKDFTKNIVAYDSFCNVPCNTGEYDKTPNGCYNLYYPLTHILEEGKFPVIETFLKHCFGEKVLSSGFTNYDLILDYISILYRHPTQMLPVGVLYSQARNTGKSTMIWLLEDIFLANYTEINSEILEDAMNDDWATKLVIAMDEGFIDKNKVLQKVKSLSTAHKIKLRGMYKGRKPVPFFGKFWMTTNDKNFIKLEEEETRFWINEVPRLTTVDPDVRVKMQDEIPYFLHFIANREILHPRVSRHWFAPELLVTDIGDKLKEFSKSWFEKELNDIMQNLFFEYRHHSLYFTQDEMVKLLNHPQAAFKSRTDDIKTQLNEKYGMYTSLQRWQHPIKPVEGSAYPAGHTETKHARCYEFKIEDFLSREVIENELSEYIDYAGLAEMRAHDTRKRNQPKTPFKAPF